MLAKRRKNSNFADKTNAMKQRVIISNNLEAELCEAIAQCEHDRIFVLTDETSLRLCWPLAERFECLRWVKMITIPSGDTNKSLDSVSHVWTELQNGGASRHSLLINMGGGMVTDLGGFAASCFKRGINFINIPTTLLAMVDASVGGKTGINFGALKNEIGVFNDSRHVILDTVFLRTLDHENILSGYAEMLKHALISDEKMWADLITFNLDNPDMNALGRMLAESVKIKERIVDEDPDEQGIRKALNVGHTAGHALESWAMRHGQSLLHGYAVAWGLIVELYLSAIKSGFPTDKMRQTVNFIRGNYGRLGITCKDYPELLELMTHDKKNYAGQINFTLLSNIGSVLINQTATDEDIKEALDFFREG